MTRRSQPEKQREEGSRERKSPCKAPRQERVQGASKTVRGQEAEVSGREECRTGEEPESGGDKDRQALGPNHS